MSTTWGQFKTMVAEKLNPYGDSVVQIDATTYTALFNDRVARALKEFTQETKLLFHRGVSVTLSSGATELSTDGLTVSTGRTATMYEVTQVKVASTWIRKTDAALLLSEDVGTSTNLFAQARENLLVFDGNPTASQSLTLRGFYDHPDFPGSSDNAVNGNTILIPVTQEDIAATWCAAKLLVGVQIDAASEKAYSEMLAILGVEIPRLATANASLTLGYHGLARGRGVPHAIYGRDGTW